MSHPFDHARSSARKYGGEPDDYLEIHAWFDQTKAHVSDWRHRMILHNTLGIFICEQVFGTTFKRKSDGAVVRTRVIGEQHVIEDLGYIPTTAACVESISLESWMGHRNHRRTGAKTVEEAMERESR